MTNTAVRLSDFALDGNLAIPYSTLEDRTALRVPSESLTFGNHVPIVAAMGMRSSVNYMLNRARALLEVEKTEQAEGSMEELVKLGISLRNDFPHPSGCMGSTDPRKVSKRVGILSEVGHTVFDFRLAVLE